MKKFVYGFVLLFILCNCNDKLDWVPSNTKNNSQNTPLSILVRKADLPGDPFYSFNYATFSIGGKGYLGTGQGISSNNDLYNRKDFYQYDPAADKWTRMADVGGTGRNGGFGFSIGSKGYIGAGLDNHKDFWEFDPSQNAWIQKADYGGGSTSDAASFVINGKAYVGTGYSNSGVKRDFWEYDPATDKWVQKADFGGSVRGNAIGFSIGSKGYVGFGNDDSGSLLFDLWEYDPKSDAWTLKGNFADVSAARFLFVLKDQSFIVGFRSDIISYNPATNLWTSVGSASPSIGLGLSIGTKGFGVLAFANPITEFYEIAVP